MVENGLMLPGFEMVDVYCSCAFNSDPMVLVLFTVVITVCLCYVDEKLLSCQKLITVLWKGYAPAWSQLRRTLYMVITFLVFASPFLPCRTLVLPPLLHPIFSLNFSNYLSNLSGFVPRILLMKVAATVVKDELQYTFVWMDIGFEQSI